MQQIRSLTDEIETFDQPFSIRVSGVRRPDQRGRLQSCLPELRRCAPIDRGWRASVRPVEDEVVDAARLPSYDLVYGFDDEVDPATVTVYDPDPERIVTAWITVEATVAVPLEDVA